MVEHFTLGPPSRTTAASAGVKREANNFCPLSSVTETYILLSGD